MDPGPQYNSFDSYAFHDNSPIHNILERFTVAIILTVCKRRKANIPARYRSRLDVYRAISALLPHLQNEIKGDCVKLAQAGTNRYQRKRPLEDEEDEHDPIRRRLDAPTPSLHHDDDGMHDITMAGIESDTDLPAEQVDSSEKQRIETASATYLIEEESMQGSKPGPEDLETIASGFQNTSKEDSRSNNKSRSDDPNQPGVLQSPSSHAGEKIACFTEVTDQKIASLIEGDFMREPTSGEKNESLAKFIDSTNKAALTFTPCGSCARELPAVNTTFVSIESIPHKEHLIPATPHRSHDLISGLLLYLPALDKENLSVSMCNECMLSLKNNKRPKFSLANDMWVGDMPRELKGLTMPERMLIAKYFPVAYIVKLYPKQKGARSWDKTQMHNGLKGNVSTYRLDPSQVATMIDGRTYPAPAKILSATIGVTFVGPRGITEATMPAMFRVRCWRVREALIWLKANNPLYQDIEISEERLQELPENGIPEEIILTAKYSADTYTLDQEHAGYVPDDVEENERMAAAGLVNADELNIDIDPAVTGMPIYANGVVDAEGEDISSSELLAHALSNSLVTQAPEDFTIRRGSAFVNEYARVDKKTGQRNDGGPSNPNHLLGCFPTLFPYAKGGFETDRPISVPYETHARWAMQYADRRFRKDLQFPFQVFGVMQKREVCRSACLRMKRSTFQRQAEIISTLTPKDLIQASKEESQNLRFSNPAVRALREELKAVRTHVKGTDESRHSVRSKIWGNNLIFNPPALWITLNPVDTQDPIAQVLAGAEIDLNQFCNTLGPSSRERGVNIASDPYASARFFHLIITRILEDLFGVKKGPYGRVERKNGILGKVQSYIGTVETQGRGSLHLHLLVWLKDAPTSHELKAALRTPEFRDKVRTFIKSTIRADINGKSKENIEALPKEVAISYSRPIDPRTSTEGEREDQEKKLARVLQFHKCSAAACLKVVQGKLECKRRCPFPLSECDEVNELGDWKPKRSCGYLNNWNPTTMLALRANHDIKLIMNGKETATLTYYITNYATKNQQNSSNVSALLAESLAYTKAIDKKEKMTDLNVVNKRLIQRCANSLTRYREFSGPEIHTYIMGWGDVYESHHYIVIFWDGAMRALKEAYPGLNNRRTYTSHGTSETLQNTEDQHSETQRTEPEMTEARDFFLNVQAGTYEEPKESIITIEIVAGKITLKDQLRDYKNRGAALQAMSFLDFMLNTYEGKRNDENGNEGDDGQDGNEPNGRRRGRPMNERVDYSADAKKGNRTRVIRSDGHETVPRFVGKWFGRNDSQSRQERNLYYSSMLLLLKPWTDLRRLKPDTETFEATFRTMVEEGDERTHRVLHNIQYFYECEDGAKARRREERKNPGAGKHIDLEVEQDEIELMDFKRLGCSYQNCNPRIITEEEIELTRITRTAAKERLSAQAAIWQAFDSGIFTDDNGEVLATKVG